MDENPTPSENPPPCARTILLRAFTRYEEGTVHVRPAFVGETHDVLGGTLRLGLLSLRDRKEYRSATLSDLAPGPLPSVSFAVGDDVPFAACQITARFTDRSGVPFVTEVLHDRAAGPMPWLGSAAGVSRRVPDPWVPLVSGEAASGGVTVESWGRSYLFGGSGLLDAVRSGGADLLARPVRLIARADGSPVSWHPGRVTVLRSDPDQVVLDQEVSSPDGLGLRARVQVDFDGTLRCDCAVVAQRVVHLSSLELEVAVSESRARYLYSFPGQWGSARNAGALPRETVSLPFRPYLWLGDEERGLSWFAESSRNFYLASPERAIEIRRERDAVVLRVRLISVPVTLRAGAECKPELTGTGVDRSPAQGPSSSSLRYCFGLQATPVKPVTETAWDHRIFCIGQTTKGFSPRLSVSEALLDELAAAGVRAVVLFEHWADAEGYVKTPHGEAVRKIAEACRARGLKLLLYFGFLISDRIEEWAEIGKDCLVLPKGGYPVYSYAPQPLQAAWRVCLASPWQDLLVDGIGRVLDELGADGVYLDGTEYPWGCCNTEHGCGRIGADGSIAPTYPIWAVRGAMRRIYETVRSRKAGGLVNVHNSTCMTMPTLGFATSTWDGEQFQSVTQGADVESLLPLDTFRAEFMGRQWGVAPEFLFAGSAYTYREAWSFALLHDVPVRAFEAGEQLALQGRIWKAMDDFGRSQAEWLPYWASRDTVAVSPEGAYASGYRRPGEGLLLVVSNCTKVPRTVTVRLDAEALGFPQGFASALDGLDGSAIERDGALLRMDLSAFGWKLVRLAP